VPDYDGRGAPDDGTNAGVWTARVVLSPLYLVTEYIIRAPLDAAMYALEKHDTLNKIYDFFAFGPDHKMGFAPIGFVEFGFNPSVGVYGWWNDAFVKNNNVHMHIEAWPTDWLAASFGDQYLWGTNNEHSVEFRAVGVNRPDNVFYGTGYDSAQYHQSRYREARTDISGKLDVHVWRSSRIKTWAGFKKVDLSDGHFGSDPSLGAQARTGVWLDQPDMVGGVPFGFNRGYSSPYGGASGVIDTRDPVDPRSGVRFEVAGDLATDVKHGSSGWAHYGGVASGYWDTDGFRRILSLTVGAEFVDQLGPDQIPVTELVSLGGDKWMTGYFPGRLRDQSAVVAMLRYDWPIASWIDGTLQGTVGNVFSEHLEDFRFERLRFSGAIGIATSTAVIASFAGAGNTQPAAGRPAKATPPRVELLAGFGTDTFERGATVQSFHLAFGFPHSF
jgi:hypothetical protein